MGHALYMKAIHGGKTKNDKIDSYKIAHLLRGGNFPVAYSYPAEWRATRDLLRRRMYIVRRCSELVAHIQNTKTQYNLPNFNKQLTRKYNHEGVAGLFPDPEVRCSPLLLCESCINTRLICTSNVSIISGINPSKAMHSPFFCTKSS